MADKINDLAQRYLLDPEVCDFLEKQQAEIAHLKQHCDDISRIKAERGKEIERLKTPVCGYCPVCGKYVGDAGKGR